MATGLYVIFFDVFVLSRFFLLTSWLFLGHIMLWAGRYLCGAGPLFSSFSRLLGWCLCFFYEMSFLLRQGK